MATKQDRTNEGKTVAIAGAFIGYTAIFFAVVIYGFQAALLVIVAVLGTLMVCIGLEVVTTETKNQREN